MNLLVLQNYLIFDMTQIKPHIIISKRCIKVKKNAAIIGSVERLIYEDC